MFSVFFHSRAPRRQHQRLLLDCLEARDVPASLVYSEGVNIGGQPYEQVGNGLWQNNPTLNDGESALIRVGRARHAPDPQPGFMGSLRGALGFPLTNIPAGAVITSVSLTLTIEDYSDLDLSTPPTVELHEFAGGTLDEATATWSTTGGGAFQANLLAATNGSDSGLVVFDSTSAMVAAAQQALDGQQPLQLIVVSPEAEAQTGAVQSMYRFWSDDAVNLIARPQLTVTYDVASNITLTNSSVAENQPSGTVVGTLGPNTGATYTLVSGLGSEGNEHFQLVGNELRTMTSFDFETQAVYSIRIQCSGMSGPPTENNFTISITDRNETPTIGSDCSNVTVAEGSIAMNGGSFNDPEGRGTVTLTASLGTVTQDDTTGIWVWNSLTVDNLNPTIVSITSRDTDGLEATTSFTITVANVAPAASLSGPSDGVRNQTLPFVLNATDPSQTDTATGFSYTVNWGDGSAPEFVPTSAYNGSGVALPHQFRMVGTYHLTMTATDKDGAVSTNATKTVVIAAMAVLPDPLNQGQNALFVGGTDAADEIQVGRESGDRYHVQIETHGGGHSEAQLPGPIARVVVFAGAGDDHVHFSGNLSVPVWADGAAGNDTLQGAENTTNVLLGGVGNDTLSAGNQQDILIGGDGADRLEAKNGDDLLIVGTTVYDTNETALFGIQQEWTSSRDFNTRVANLRGTGTGARANGEYFLKNTGSGATVFDDGVVDVLKGGNGRDWFFTNRLGAGVLDRLSGLQLDDVVDDL